MHRKEIKILIYVDYVFHLIPKNIILILIFSLEDFHNYEYMQAICNFISKLYVYMRIASYGGSVIIF